MDNYFESKEYQASELYLKEQIKQDNLRNDEGDIYESAINNAFVAGAKWMKQELIGKACLYMFENLHGETLTLRMIDDFKKAMEE